MSIPSQPSASDSTSLPPASVPAAPRRRGWRTLLLALLKIGMPEVGGRQADGGGDDGPRAPVEVLGPDEV